MPIRLGESDPLSDGLFMPAWNVPVLFALWLFQCFVIVLLEVQTFILLIFSSGLKYPICVMILVANLVLLLNNAYEVHLYFAEALTAVQYHRHALVKFGYASFVITVVYYMTVFADMTWKGSSFLDTLGTLISATFAGALFVSPFVGSLYYSSKVREEEEGYVNDATRRWMTW